MRGKQCPPRLPPYRLFPCCSRAGGQKAGTSCRTFRCPKPTGAACSLGAPSGAGDHADFALGLLHPVGQAQCGHLATGPGRGRMAGWAPSTAPHGAAVRYLPPVCVRSRSPPLLLSETPSFLPRGACQQEHLVTVLPPGARAPTQGRPQPVRSQNPIRRPVPVHQAPQSEAGSQAHARGGWGAAGVQATACGTADAPQTHRCRPGARRSGGPPARRLLHTEHAGDVGRVQEESVSLGRQLCPAKNHSQAEGTPEGGPASSRRESALPLFPRVVTPDQVPSERTPHPPPAAVPDMISQGFSVLGHQTPVCPWAWPCADQSLPWLSRPVVPGSLLKDTSASGPGSAPGLPCPDRVDVSGRPWTSPLPCLSRVLSFTMGLHQQAAGR